MLDFQYNVNIWVCQMRGKLLYDIHMDGVDDASLCIAFILHHGMGTVHESKKTMELACTHRG